jgi:hypothetical protein
MSGNSHQKKVVATAVASALKSMGIASASVSTLPSNAPTASSPQGSLGRGSIEAYAFFIMAGVYTVMSAFGQTVSFLAGTLMACVMAGCAIHLVVSSIWTANWNRLARVVSVGIIVVTLGIVVNSGYHQTHRPPNVSPELSATQTGFAWLRSELPKLTQVIQSNTQVLEVDGKYPDIELSEPRDVAVAGGPPLVNIDERNIGTDTALSKRESVGLFIAPRSVSSENAIFHYLYKTERDKGLEYNPSSDLAPGPGGIIPIGAPVLTENGTEVMDVDRRALFEKTKVMYTAALIGYQSRNGHIFHKELCYLYTGANVLSIKCSGHNGHG